MASFLPWLLTRWGVDNTAPAGELPDSVRYAFYLGAAVLFLSISWTVLRTREYSPAELAAFEPAPAPAA